MVRVLYNSELRPICAVGWDNVAANVACRELGSASATNVNTLLGQAETLAWLTYIRCNGDETALSYCRHGGFLKRNCSDNRFAGVSCSE